MLPNVPPPPLWLAWLRGEREEEDLELSDEELTFVWREGARLFEPEPRGESGDRWSGMEWREPSSEPCVTSGLKI